MEILFMIIGFVFIFLILRITYQKRKGIVPLVSFKHIDGLNELAKGIDVDISFEENTVKIDHVNIPISTIDRLEISSSKQLVEEEKSVIGRAIVGTIIAGPVGAVVGGASGISNGKTVTKLMYFLTMTFKDGEYAIFSFNRDRDRFDVENAIKRISGIKRGY